MQPFEYSRRKEAPAHPWILRTLLVLFFCTGIAFLGLLTGGEHRLADARRGQRDRMKTYFPTDMPHYPDAHEVPAGESSRVGSAELRMSFFVTSDDCAKVARYYSDFWRTRRFFVDENVTHQGGVVTAIDAEHQQIYQLLLSVSGSQTLAFPSLSQTPLLALKADPRPLSIPMFPDSQVLLTASTEEHKAHARIVLSINQGGLQENLAYYRRELEAAGYQTPISKQPPSGQSSHMLLYQKEGHEVTLSLSALNEKTVRVHWVEIDS